MPGIVQVTFCGGFGNALFMYAAVRSYAQLIDAKFECPDWVGRRIFDIDDPYPSCVLPDVNGGASFGPPTVDIEAKQTNVRISDYFQHDRWARIMSRSQLQKWLQVRPELLNTCASPRPALAAHMRQGDYIGWGMFANLREGSYLRACEEHGLPVEKLVWVKQDEPRIVQGIDSAMSFLPDFVTLMQADILLRANSTFAFWAGVLGHGEVYAPVVEDHIGWYDATFVKGNHPRTAHTNRTGVLTEDLYLKP